jgi:hypothetical protein
MTTRREKPKRKRQPQRDQDDAKKAIASPGPSAPRWEAEAENIRKRRASPFWQGMAAEQERMRLIGEKLGMNLKLRKAETAPPSPQGPTPQQRKRGRSGGRKRSLSPEQIKEGIDILRNQPRMTVEAARETLRAAGIKGEDGPLYRLVIKPAYGGMSK